ncbi:uncharacterized protein LOC121736375 [Aricia agestis]|uniref:uncharacterized protein LOC121736375 n=1 Tax=Aricia agestis TaxID=91739 RepID=UPI001C20358B|nr:uncharacterized protein LOC121736375 [Aricia agestis]
MDKIKFNSKSNSDISLINKTDRKSVRDRKDNAKTIISNVIKKRGVYVEKFSGIEPNSMEELSQGNNKKLLESVLSTLTKSSKATQWPGEKKINKENVQFRKKKVESKERTPIIVLKPNSTVNKTEAIIPNRGVGKPLAKTKNPQKTSPQAKVKIAAEKAPTKSKINVNRTTVAKYKTADIKTTSKGPEKTAPNITHEYVARRVKRYLLRQASPDNTLISDEIKKPEENSYDIEAKSEDTLDDTEHDAKIYSLIEDYLENAINICSDNLSDKSVTNLQIDEEVAKKLMIIESDGGSQRSLVYCPYTKNSSMTTVKTCVEDISKTLEKQHNISVGKECMAEVKIKKEENIKSKRYSKNAKPIIINNKSNSLEPSKQKTRRKPAPVQKFVNRTDFLVQNIYNIQLNSHKLKTKKIESVKHLKNPAVFQKPQNFFETLSLILKNKNRTYKSLYPNMDLKLQHLKNFANDKKFKYK